MLQLRGQDALLQQVAYGSIFSNNVLRGISRRENAIAGHFASSKSAPATSEGLEQI